MRLNIPRNKTFKVISFAFIFISLIFYTCTCSYIARYSHFAYQQTISLKVEALALMDKATKQFASHENEIKELETKIEKAYEYAKGRPKNELSTKQWQILKDPNRNLLGGFINRWRKKLTLSAHFIKEAKGLVADAFDTISGLESGKIKKSDVK